MSTVNTTTRSRVTAGRGPKPPPQSDRPLRAFHRGWVGCRLHPRADQAAAPDLPTAGSSD